MDTSRSKDALRRLAVQLFLALLMAPLLALFLGVSAASAAPTPSVSPNGTQTQLICSQASTGASTATDNLLPVNRWSGAIGNEHTRLPGGLFSSVANAPNTVDRSIFVGGMTSIGAAEWQLGTATTEAASQFCFANTVGADANSLAASLGNAIANSGLVAILAVVALLAVLWKASRGRESPLKHVVKIAVVVGLFAAIVAAATVSNTTGTPTPISPAWFITTAYNAISNIASAPASAIASGANAVVGGTSQQRIATQDPLSCSWYTKELVAQYKSAYTNAGSYGYVVPTSMNALWEQAAIPAYTSEQFGNGNNFGPLIYCHLLEDQAGIAPAAQLGVALESGTLSGDTNLASFPHPESTSLAWNGAITSNQEDESMVAWAACQSPNTGSGFAPTEWNSATGATTPSAWTNTTNLFAQQNGPADTTVSGADCQVFWSANAPATGGQYGDAAPGGPFSNPSAAPWTGSISNPDYSVFNWGNSPTTIANATNNFGASGQEIGNFLGNLHGTSNGSAIAVSFIFLLTSTVVMVIFLVLGLAVIIAKLGLLLSMALLPIMLLLALMPGGAGAGKFGAYAKHLFGLILFATCAVILLSFIAIITGMLADIGVAAAGQGSLFALIWVAIAPITAVVVIHMFFKKVLKAPSPFKPTSAMAYGTAMGGFAAGGLAGADLFSHMKRQGSKVVSKGVSRARNSMGGSQAQSGPTRRRQSMGRTPGPDGLGSGPNQNDVAPSGASSSRVGAGAAPGPAAGATTGVAAVSQSMFRSRGRQRRVETEQYEADRWASGERMAQRTKRLETVKGGLLSPGYTAGAAVGGAKKRFDDSLARSKGRFNQERGGDNHRVQGSLLTAAAAGGAMARGAKKLPKIAKYGALSVTGVGLAGLGAPALAVVGGLYGVHKLRQHHRGAPLRQEQRLTSYQAHLAEEKKGELAAEKARVDAAALTETERQAAESRTAEERAAMEQAREQMERAFHAREQRIDEWKRGTVAPYRERQDRDVRGRFQKESRPFLGSK